MTAITPILGIEYPVDTDNPNTLGIHTAMQNMAEDLDAKFGQFTTWTPQVDQGVTTNIAKTVQVARYKEIGKLIEFEMRLSMTGAGTASSKITITLPVACRTVGPFPVGWGGVEDISVPTKGGRWASLDTGVNNKFGFRIGPTTLLGVSSHTLAAGDIIYCTGFYERA